MYPVVSTVEVVAMIIFPVRQGRLMCRPRITMLGQSWARGTHEARGGAAPGLHFTNIYGRPLCARHCAGHWGHRDEWDTLSTCPCSSLPSFSLPGA